MKKLFSLILVLFLVPAAFAQPSLTTSESYSLPLYAYDSAGVDLIPPESLFVVVYDGDGDSVFTLLGDTANAVCKGPYLRRYGNGSTANEYTYFATVATLDGTTGGVGYYRVEALVWNSTANVTWRITGGFYEVTVSWDTFMDSVLNNMDDGAITVTKAPNLDAAITTRSSFAAATDSVIVDGSSLAATTDAISSTTLDFTAALEISDTTWDEILTGGTHNIGNSAGRRIREIEDATLISTGTSARVGSANSIILATAETYADDILIGNIVEISSGTGAGQTRKIIDNVGAADSVVVERAWVTNPDATSVYELEPFAHQVLLSSSKVTLADSSAAAIKWMSYYMGVGQETAGPGKVGMTTLGTFRKDTAFVFNNALNDTLMKIVYIRNVANGPVDSIRFIVP